jgi:hypothetical protein
MLDGNTEVTQGFMPEVQYREFGISDPSNGSLSGRYMVAFKFETPTENNTHSNGKMQPEVTVHYLAAPLKHLHWGEGFKDCVLTFVKEYLEKTYPERSGNWCPVIPMSGKRFHLLSVEVFPSV